MLIYCFEQNRVESTLKKCKRNDLAVIDTDNIDPDIIRKSVKRGVHVYGYINIGALEKERSYYNRFKYLRVAKYDGWNGEYWVDPTNMKWCEHIYKLALQIKDTGAIGVYLDNTDIYYMCKEGFREEKAEIITRIPHPENVYKSLAYMVVKITVGAKLIVMPNGGDLFVKRFIEHNPYIIATINQEGLFYEDFKKQPPSETEYRKKYMDWCSKHIVGKVRGIEYCRDEKAIKEIKRFYCSRGWDVYISPTKNLTGL